MCSCEAEETNAHSPVFPQEQGCSSHRGSECLLGTHPVLLISPGFSILLLHVAHGHGDPSSRSARGLQFNIFAQQVQPLSCPPWARASDWPSSRCTQPQRLKVISQGHLWLSAHLVKRAAAKCSEAGFRTQIRVAGHMGRGWEQRHSPLKGVVRGTLK